jgi:hypothetical protein
MKGQARGSTDEQNLALQLDAPIVFEDAGSGADENRKGVADALTPALPELACNRFP